MNLRETFPWPGAPGRVRPTRDELLALVMKGANLKEAGVSANDLSHVIAEHLTAQKRVARGPDNSCAYRSHGQMCAVGCLIPDSLYDGGMEHKSSDSLLDQFSSLRSLRPYRVLLGLWQQYHDGHSGHDYGAWLWHVMDGGISTAPSPTEQVGIIHVRYDGGFDQQEVQHG